MRRGIDDCRSANGQENIAGVRGEICLGHCVLGQLFFEPDDIGSKQAAAIGTFRRNVVCFGPVAQNGAFIKAFSARDVAVEFNDVPASGALMQAVHVLRDEMELRKMRFHFCEREVRRIGAGIGDELAPPFIPFPNKPGIAAEGAGSGQLFRFVFCPEAGLRIAESRDATLGGNARAGESSHGFRGGEAGDQFGRNCHARVWLEMTRTT